MDYKPTFLTIEQLTTQSTKNKKIILNSNISKFIVCILLIIQLNFTLFSHYIPYSLYTYSISNRCAKLVTFLNDLT